jgi:hypothetical protein
MTGLRQATVLRQAQLTEDANYVSTLTLTRAIILRLRDSVNSLLIYGLVRIVEKIGNLPEFSDVGVWSKLSQEPTKLWGPNLYDRRYESHEPL